MELRQIEHFVAVTEELSFTRAANRCHVGQSALSLSIRTLEKELGVALFARTTRRVELTDAARAFLPGARRALDAVTCAQEAVGDVQHLLKGSLRLGGVPTPLGIDQAALLARFSADHPGVDIDYVRALSIRLIAAVQRGRLDLAIINIPPDLPDNLESTRLVTKPLVFVCRPDHPLAQCHDISLKDLVHERFIGGPSGTSTHEAIQRVFAIEGGSQRFPFIVDEPSAILDFISAGLGVSLLPEYYLARNHSHLRAIPVFDESLTWTLGVVTPRDRMTPPARAFLGLIREFVT